MILRLLLSIFICLVPVTASADFLGCYEPSEVVELKVLYLDADGSSANTVTSTTCTVFDPNDTTGSENSCTNPSQVGSITGLYETTFTVPGSPLEGSWLVRWQGTISSVVKEGIDTFFVVDVAGECATRSATAGFSYCDVTASTDTNNLELGACKSPQGESITLATDWNELWGIVAYTNGGSACNVVGQGGMVQDATLDGANVDIVMANDSSGRGGFTAAPSATNCGMLIVK